MKLTDRERIMLYFLLGVAIIAVSYFLIFKPQLEQYTALSAQKTQLETDVQMIKAEMLSGAKLDKEIEGLYAKISDNTAVFYPVLSQDRILVLLNNIINKIKISCDAISFSNASAIKLQNDTQKTEEIFPIKNLVDSFELLNQQQDSKQNPDDSNRNAAENQNSVQANSQTGNASEKQDDNVVQRLSVQLKLKGDFSQYMTFIKELEAQKRVIVINNLVLGSSEQNIVSGDMQIDFYAIPKIVSQDKEYLNWPFNKTYGKANPFIK